MALSPSTPKLLKHSFERNSLAAFTLGDGLDKHPFGFFISLKRLVALWQQNGNRCAFRQFCTQQLDSPVDHMTRSYAHDWTIVPVLDP